MLRRLVLASLATAAAGTAGLGPLPPLPLLSPPEGLTVTVSESGHPDADGTFELRCDDRAGGNHPARENACERLGQLAKEGANPFEPVPADQFCAQVYGGPARAHITGTWQGRTVDARFSRANGCEINRWENLEPVLPLVRG
ncbi:SSI family serine proteinase inhibitor [Streptomyces sp. TX20-6-3]|uniref:SSI family serine proteinase inhibitor n=1 Tax=Streptomyces sp. TX20-6-3 TaxID=3028705 RepID=UPI0029A3D826|nr:SSI family serine proteinase inhibitor [Streptomyces sp. TX20-6-3]MDX2562311.1 SSI family serine proteinase inhibitor [Streptomyces sp. TX20-6-3]